MWLKRKVLTQAVDRTSPRHLHPKMSFFSILQSHLKGDTQQNSYFFLYGTTPPKPLMNRRIPKVPKKASKIKIAILHLRKEKIQTLESTLTQNTQLQTQKYGGSPLDRIDSVNLLVHDLPDKESNFCGRAQAPHFGWGEPHKRVKTAWRKHNANKYP